MVFNILSVGLAAIILIVIGIIVLVLLERRFHKKVADGLAAKRDEDEGKLEERVPVEKEFKFDNEGGHRGRKKDYGEIVSVDNLDRIEKKIRERAMSREFRAGGGLV